MFFCILYFICTLLFIITNQISNIINHHSLLIYSFISNCLVHVHISFYSKQKQKNLDSFGRAAKTNDDSINMIDINPHNPNYNYSSGGEQSSTLPFERSNSPSHSAFGRDDQDGICSYFFVKHNVYNFKQFIL